MPETAENVAEEFSIAREDQDPFAYGSQQKAAQAIEAGYFAEEITPAAIPQRKAEQRIVETDELPRPETTLEGLEKLRAPFREGGSMTAGNASGVNDGTCAIPFASEEAAKAHGLTPRARIVAMSTTGVEHRIMAFGPAPASRKVLDKAGMTPDQMDVIELNEAFASQALVATRSLGLTDDGPSGKPQRRRHCLGPPAWRKRCTPGDYRNLPTSQEWRPLCSLRHVYWCWAGQQ